MRPDVDCDRVLALLSAIGKRLRTAHTLYLVGGSSAVLVGWRLSTRDVDVRPEPDSDELLRVLYDLKNVLVTDLDDVRTMIDRQLVSPEELHDGFAEMSERLFRFPGVDAERFERRIVGVAGHRQA